MFGISCIICSSSQCDFRKLLILHRVEKNSGDVRMCWQTDDGAEGKFLFHIIVDGIVDP